MQERKYLVFKRKTRHGVIPCLVLFIIAVLAAEDDLAGLADLFCIFDYVKRAAGAAVPKDDYLVGIVDNLAVADEGSSSAVFVIIGEKLNKL